MQNFYVSINNSDSIVRLQRMANGDLVRLHRGRSNSAVPGDVLSYEYSTDGGATWSASGTVTGWSGGQGGILLAAVGSTTNANVLYAFREYGVFNQYVYPYVTWKVYAETLTYNTTTHALASSASSTVLISQVYNDYSAFPASGSQAVGITNDGTHVEVCLYVPNYSDPYSSTPEHAERYITTVASFGTAALTLNGTITPTQSGTRYENPALAPYDGLISESITGVSTSMTGLPLGSTGLDMHADPVFLGYLLDAGQYRLVAGVLNSSFVNIYVKVAGSATWQYSGTVTVPYSSTNYGWDVSGQFQPVKASPAVGGTAIGTTIRFSYNHESYYNGGPGGYSSLSVSWGMGAGETNAQPVVTAISPINGTKTFDQNIDNIQLSWSITDADDTGLQVQYVCEIVENVAGATSKWVKADGTLATVSTAVTTSTQSATINAGQLAASTYGYKWRVRASDIHGAFSVDTPFSTFRVSGRPTASITYPVANAIVTTNHPTFSWTYADPEGTAMTASRIKVYNIAGVLLYDSGPVVNSATSGSTASQGLTGYVLPRNAAYTVGVLCSDGTGAWSGESTRQFNFKAVYPGAPTIALSFSVDGIATITLTASAALPASVTHDLYRWSPRVQDYVLVVAGLAPSATYIDAGAAPNSTITYKVVTHATDAATLETISSPVSYTDADWRIASGATALMVVPVKFSATNPREQESLEPLGRSTPVVAEFELLGAEGQITLDLTSASRESDIAALEALSDTTETVYIKSPLGEVFNVSLGSLQVTPGVGGRAEATVSYIEVADA